MLDNVRIRNYKSIDDLSIDLGRFNVFIGENGCGKSNILEGIGFASAAFHGNIENESLAIRGIRGTDAKLMRSGFDTVQTSKEIRIDLNIIDNKLTFTFDNDNKPFSKWKFNISLNDSELKDTLSNNLDKILDQTPQQLFLSYFEFLKEKKERKEVLEELLDDKSEARQKFIEDLAKAYNEAAQNTIAQISDRIIELNKTTGISDYMIFAPENFFLRNYSLEDVYMEPLGYRGEGLLKLIKIIKKENRPHYDKILENLSLIDWFSSFDISEDSLLGETQFLISDKYLEDGLKSFDIRNANEGFFFILFYITLFTSDYTPSFFSIDNIDTALNPRLCGKLITILSDLAIKNNKQVIITTHNPSVLDGLNLNNDQERLFVVSRNAIGNTRVKRIEKKSPLEGEQPVKLSEQFLRGYIGGLPKNF